MSGPVLFPIPPAATSVPVVTIDPEPWRLYRESIACNAPETVALLGGRLDAPLRITDFFFMPPPHRGDRFAHGPAHVELDHAAMNYVVDRVLVPNGKYMLGLWHSHPGRCTAPSEPDRCLCGAILRNDDSPGRGWPFFLAPITTFDANGRDRVTAWVMRKGRDVFEPARFEPPAPPRLLAATDAPGPDGPPPAVAALPAAALPAASADLAASDPLAASALRLGALLAGPDGLVGVPRYRAGLHLHAALRLAEGGAAAEPQP